MTNKHYNAGLNSYNEAEALQQLLRAANDTLDAEVERLDTNADDALIDQFTITIGGVQTAFFLGGPQIEALYRFIKHIADENFYDVDIDNGTVTG